ncbi:S8 family serine peptidase [Thalassotalea psychrophila]|uniref:S8 family serine peptidase n=1 Tax=Thalassotalea psychrophila TaxID=3065647 RepID=A0ABY9TYA8_9GAMM|nr:S8 family serine peptidase [Colwelliaceae bacterium SQ149]
MIFKSTAIAVFASSLLSPAIAQANSGDTSTAASAPAMQGTFAKQPARGVYAITLKADAAGLQHQDPQTKAKLAKITQVQNDVFAFAQRYDNNVKLALRTRLLSNMLTIELNEDAANALKTHADVAVVSLIFSLDEQSNQQMAAKDDSEGFSGGDFNSKYPFLKVNDAGDNVTVAIIGQGVDYTHTALGGEKNDKLDNYGVAFQNVTNAWEGFPNDVVIGGFDFVSESGGYDYNPLEYHSDITDRRWDSLEFKAGYGSATALAVLQAVPNAKILAYKVEGVSYEGDVFRDNYFDAKFVAALELAIDPNLDGDISDRADIIQISRSVGGWTFVDDNDTGHSNSSVGVQFVRDIAATGALVITGAGNFGQNETYYNIAYRGMAPEALTVGFAHREDTSYAINPNSPVGPTRGPVSVLKPDVVSVTDEMIAPRVASNTGYVNLEDNDRLALTRTTAAAASIMDAHPQLTAAEVKALLVNTGINNIANSHGVAQVGGGSVNPIAATTSHALMYQKGNYQPSLNFSQVKVFGQSSFSKEVVIKNLSDKTQHYNVVINKNGDKVNNNAVAVSFPSQITLPPLTEVSVPVTITVDENKLAANPFALTQDFRSANWDKYAINGNITLEHEVSPGASIHIPWLIMPSRGGIFAVDNSFNKDSWTNIRANDNDFRPPHDANWRNKVPYAVTQDYNRVEVENVTNVAQTLYAMPIIYHSEDYRIGTPRTGNIIKTIAGDIVAEQQCLSGNKLSLAITYFDEIQLPTSKHFDRFAGVMTSIQLYNKESIEMADNKARFLDELQNTAGHLTRLDLRLNEQQQFATQYVDQKLPYNPWNPRTRYKWTELETVAVPGGDTIVTNICTDKLFHGPINAETFNDIIGLQFSSDRDNIPGYYDDVLTHNFNLGGHSVVSEIEDQEEVVSVECSAGFIKDNNDNCIKIYDEDTIDVDLAEWVALSVGEDKEEFKFHCGSYDEQETTTCTASHSKTFEFEFRSPNRNPDGLICDFYKESTTAVCHAKNLVRDNGDIEDKLFWRVSFNITGLIAPPPVISDNSFLTGVAIKLKNAAVADIDANWTNQITLQPGERALVSYLRDNACGGTIHNPTSKINPVICSEGGYVFDPVSGFKRIAHNNSTYVRVAKGQEFSVSEDSQIGDVIGTVRTTSKYIRETYGRGSEYYDLWLLDGGFGAPFHLSSQGVLSVRDPQMLDFEDIASYQLTVSSRGGNYQSAADTIKVNVRNANDNAPQLLSAIGDITMVQHQAIENISFAHYFSDIDGIGLVFSASELPQGLDLDKAGILTGTPTVNGEFSASILVTDGVHTLASDIHFNIAKDENSNGEDTEQESKGSSGGAATMLLFAVIALTRRRLVKSIQQAK